MGRPSLLWHWAGLGQASPTMRQIQGLIVTGEEAEGSRSSSTKSGLGFADSKYNPCHQRIFRGWQGTEMGSQGKDLEARLCSVVS